MNSNLNTRLIIYNFFITLFILIYFPFYCLRLIFFSKYRRSTLPRLGWQKIPFFFKDDEVYWIHAVSVGEVKAAEGLVKEIKKNCLEAKIVISTITETGQNEAKKIEGIEGSFYYPIDLYFLIKFMINKVKPKYFIVVETDLWANILYLCKKSGVKIFLINGKLSTTSLSRYKKFSFLSQLFFKSIDCIFSQTQTYTDRFIDVGVDKNKLITIGNLKLDKVFEQSSQKKQKQLLKNFGLDNDKLIVVFASTHKGEEELAVKLFNKNDINMVLAPRHPERFGKIAKMLDSEIGNYNKFSDFVNDNLPQKSFILLDTLGKLMNFYEVCDLAIVAGSFTSAIGGHNIFEPAWYKKPFVYGNYLYKQPGFEQLAKDYGAGIQCRAEQLQICVESLLKDEKKRRDLGEAGYRAVQSSQGLVAKVYQIIKQY